MRAPGATGATGATAYARRASGLGARATGAAALALLLACAPRPGGGAAATRGLHLEPVASGFDHPVHAAAPPGDARLFVVEKSGWIRIVRDGRILRRPFLDLHDQVSRGSEQGLLSIAFHPAYARNRTFFVYYTDKSGHSRLVRYRASPDRDVADPASAVQVLLQRQPYSNHNGGLAAFGPDGMLYIGLGDGGSGGDPQDNGQNLGTMLGKLLRIDVDRGAPYAIPPDNPFVARRGARPEIWAYGLRNPWRFSFDPAGGMLYIGDVGQDLWEEVDVAPAGRGGLDYGWALREGAHAFKSGRARGAQVEPAVEYPREQGCTVIGGAVYRGSRSPSLRGLYFYADYCQGWLRSFRWAEGRATEPRTWRIDHVLQPSSFGEDGAGELLIVSLSGEVYRIVED